MGVEDDVGSHPSLREGHVFGGPHLAAHPLLSMPAGKLVTNHRVPLQAQSSFLSITPNKKKFLIRQLPLPLPFGH